MSWSSEDSLAKVICCFPNDDIKKNMMSLEKCKMRTRVWWNIVLGMAKIKMLTTPSVNKDMVQFDLSNLPVGMQYGKIT